MKKPKIESFDFASGTQITNQFTIIRKLGGGWEGEVYLVEESETKIHRAVKFFYPHRNVKNRAIKHYAKKLHDLRSCPVLIQYMSQDFFYHNDLPVSYLISEYVEGLRLDRFLDQCRSKRLNSFEALHLLHALVIGLEPIHRLKEYHGDLHTENIIVYNYGLHFELKLLDMFHWGSATKAHYMDDLHNAIKVFHETLGGSKTYKGLPKEIKEICCGLRKDLIVKKFRSISGLRQHLEAFSWQLN